MAQSFRGRAEEIVRSLGRLHADIGKRPDLSIEEKEALTERLYGAVREALLAIDALEMAGDVDEVKRLADAVENVRKRFDSSDK